jgi:hypothetical protein
VSAAVFTKTRVAAKRHGMCARCGKGIGPGETYEAWFAVVGDGSGRHRRQVKAHLVCPEEKKKKEEEARSW